MKWLCWIFLMALLPLSSRADLNNCSAIFSDPQMEKAAISQLLQQHYGMENVSVLEDLILRYSARKIWKSKEVSTPQFNQNLLKIDGLIRQGLRISHDESHANSTPESQWVGRNILSGNLRQMFTEFGYAPVTSENFIKKVLSNKALRFLLNPSSLPDMADKPISSELIQKILQDGMNAHETELSDLFTSSGQNKVAAYRRLTTTYRIFATVVMAYIMWEQNQKFQAQVNNLHKDQLNQSLDKMDDLANILDQEFQKRGMYKN